ncbi:prepilin-type N-terminal cleavage/methylation domain-containing protein [Sporosarcina sp. NPDC096371]|uniref:prepilin-type N-terminal cleavage/methylation domain-containing protein n=1 Tax=Sporosarcina sp. NPDC096371 TaxID=3364530 RepID=UPI0037F7FCE4
MLNKFKKQMKNEKGLTLIELLAVVVILAIIAAIAIPAIGNIIKNSQVGALKSDTLNAISAAELYLLDNPTATTIKLDDIDGTATNATGDPYLDDKGGLTAFEFTVSGKKISSTAKKGNITLTAVGATKQQIINFANNTKTGGTGPVSVTR